MENRPYRLLPPASSPFWMSQKLLLAIGFERCGLRRRMRLRGRRAGSTRRLEALDRETNRVVASRFVLEHAWRAPVKRGFAARAAWCGELLPFVANAWRQVTEHSLLSDLDPEGARAARGLTLLGAVSRRLERQAFEVRPVREVTNSGASGVVGAIVGAVVAGFAFHAIGIDSAWSVGLSAGVLPLAAGLRRLVDRNSREILVRRSDAPELRLTDSMEDGAYVFTLRGPEGVSEGRIDPRTALDDDLAERDAAAITEAVAAALSFHGVEWRESVALGAD